MDINPLALSNNTIGASYEVNKFIYPSEPLPRYELLITGNLQPNQRLQWHASRISNADLMAKSLAIKKVNAITPTDEIRLTLIDPSSSFHHYEATLNLQNNFVNFGEIYIISFAPLIISNNWIVQLRPNTVINQGFLYCTLANLNGIHEGKEV